MGRGERSDGALDFVGTETSCTDVYMARSTIDNRLDALYIGLPHSVGPSVGMGDLNAKGNALAANIALSHSLHLQSVEKSPENPGGHIHYNTRLAVKLQGEKGKKPKIFKIRLISQARFAIIDLYQFCGNLNEVTGMIDTYSVPLTQLVQEFKLIPAYRSSDYEAIRVTVEDVSRPGLQLAGYFDHFEPMRLQVLGNVEMSYLRKISREQRSIIFDRLFSFKIPALIIARDMDPDETCMEMARKHDITILRCQEATSYMVSSVISFLKNALAPRITRHGVLVDVYGEGLLLMGESGIGKSEAAVELIKRGHRLIADDAVEIKKISSTSLMGTAPDLIRNYIELRGIGVINVAKLFGMGAIKGENVIDLLINIVPWSNHAIYDRLGLEEQYIDILGVKVPQITIPVTPGRNLAVILEAAAMNNRQKKMGYNAAVEFTEQINKHFDESMGQQF